MAPVSEKEAQEQVSVDRNDLVFDVKSPHSSQEVSKKKTDVTNVKTVSEKQENQTHKEPEPTTKENAKRDGEPLEKQFVKREKKSKVKRKYKQKPVEPTSPMGILEFEIKELLQEHKLNLEDIENDMKLILNDPHVEKAYHKVVSQVKIMRLTSNGDGLSLIDHPDESLKNKKQVVIVPFGLPGDVVTIKVFRSHPLYVESDLLKIETASDLRNDSLINCNYFGKCSGCQYQNVPYEDALKIKQNVIKNAYKFFAPRLIEAKRLPIIDETEPSPLKYNYRTKLTPHFSIPNARLKKNKPLESRPPVGFGAKGRPKWRETSGGESSTVDIEECSIGTPIINIGMKNERNKFVEEYQNYKKGATILLRENTKQEPEFNEKSESVEFGTTDKVSFIKEGENFKTCVTDSRFIVNEFVNTYRFKFSAGEFFQNNNSILPRVTDYVRSNLFIKLEEIQGQGEEENFLVDAYCGSGLFSITCSKNVKKVIGVEVSADSVKFARLNAEINQVQNANFIVGKAEEIFKDIDLPADKTSIILDPPRKGCDDVFLNQLSDFCPNRIIYISCNVHSQARDLEWFINNTTNGNKYEVVSVKGFDFFPQTHHVESVAILRKKH